MTDFSKILIRASAFGKLMTEPKDVAAKKNGDLSKTAKTYLKQLYIEEIWGLSKEIRNKFCDKGKMVEEETLTLLSRLDKKLYIKNDIQLKNEYFKGEPDIFRGKDINHAEYLIDAKSSWDAWTFMDVFGEKLNSDYECQMQIYFNLCNCKEGEVSYCLISTPQTLIDDEKRRLFYNMNAGTEFNPDYMAAVEELELSSRFDHIPMEHRRIKFPVKRDDEFIELAKQKVVKAREYLQELHERHIGKTVLV